MKIVIDWAAASHNWFADRDFLWWPFSFLRPEPKEFMSFQHTLLMTACFGGLTFLMFTLFTVVNNQFTLSLAFSLFMGSFISFFLWFNLITKPFWNYRAKQLSK